MNTKLIINIVLAIIAIGLAYYLYIIIQEPIVFNKAKEVRYEAAVKQLRNIRTAQLTYKDKYGKFATKMDILLKAMRDEEFAKIAVTGNPDDLEGDSTAVVIYDTTWVPMYQQAFGKTYPKDSVQFMQYIPYTNKSKIIEMAAGKILENRVVEIPVFEAKMPEKVLLEGLNKKYIDRNHEITVGSLEKGTYSGNWE